MRFAPWVKDERFRIVRGATTVHATMDGWPSTFCHWAYNGVYYAREEGRLEQVTCQRCLKAMRRLGYVEEE